MQTLEQRWNSLWQRINRAAEHAGRDSRSIALVAVTKTVPPEKIEVAYRLGQRHFAENYLQEALDKQIALKERCPDIVWHFIGHIQSRKAALIAQHFDWVHSIDRIEIAERLHQMRPPTLPPLNICLQINISHEDSKHGLMTDTSLPSLLKALQPLTRLRLRGLMGMAAPDLSEAQQREQFAWLRHLHQQLQPSIGADWDVLSMGMSSDLEAAIAEGSTHLRIGSALFGERPPKLS